MASLPCNIATYNNVISAQNLLVDSNQLYALLLFMKMRGKEEIVSEINEIWKKANKVTDPTNVATNLKIYTHYLSTSNNIAQFARNVLNIQEARLSSLIALELIREIEAVQAQVHAPQVFSAPAAPQSIPETEPIPRRLSRTSIGSLTEEFQLPASIEIPLTPAALPATPLPLVPSPVHADQARPKRKGSLDDEIQVVDENRVEQTEDAQVPIDGNFLWQVALFFKEKGNSEMYDMLKKALIENNIQESKRDPKLQSHVDGILSHEKTSQQFVSFLRKVGLPLISRILENHLKHTWTTDFNAVKVTESAKKARDDTQVSENADRAFLLRERAKAIGIANQLILFFAEYGEADLAGAIGDAINVSEISERTNVELFISFYETFKDEAKSKQYIESLKNLSKVQAVLTRRFFGDENQFVPFVPKDKTGAPVYLVKDQSLPAPLPIPAAVEQPQMDINDEDELVKALEQFRQRASFMNWPTTPASYSPQSPPGT